MASRFSTRSNWWILLLAAILGSSVSLSAQESFDHVVVSVNDSVITHLQLDRRVRDLTQIYALPDGPTKGRIPTPIAVRRRAVNDLIDDELLLEQAEGLVRMSVAERSAERAVEYQIESLKESIGEEAFLARLAQENHTLEDFKAAMKEERLRFTLIRQVRASLIDQHLTQPIPQSKTDEYLQEHPEISDEGAAPEVQFIFLRTQPDAPPQGDAVIREKAVRLITRARAGESFDDLVEEFSQHEQSRDRGGILQIVSRQIPYPEFGPLFDAEAGQVYPEPIKITGWLVVAKVRNKQSAHNVVRRKIAEEEAEKALQELRDEARIQYHPNLFTEGQ